MARSSTNRRERRLAEGASVRQMPFGKAVNRYPPIQVVSADEIEAIHHASLTLLRDTGMEIMHSESRELFRAAGADVDESTQRVRFDPAFVEEKIRTAPSSFTLYAAVPVPTPKSLACCAIPASHACSSSTQA